MIPGTYDFALVQGFRADRPKGSRLPLAVQSRKTLKIITFSILRFAGVFFRGVTIDVERKVEFTNSQPGGCYRPKTWSNEMYAIIKSLPASPSQTVSNRYRVKTFKTSEAMWKFLSTGSNSLVWKETESPLKAGTYFSRIEKRDGKNQIVYLDVKTLNV